MPAQAEIASALLRPDAATPSGLSMARRFDVYRNNVLVGLSDALAQAYPAVVALVGDRFFRAAAIGHIRQHPPTSPVLIHYGGEFPAFLETFPPARRIPYLADVARLERAWLEVYHAKDRRPAPLAALAGLPENSTADCRIDLHPAVRMVSSRWPIVSLWAANTGRGEHASVDLSRPETVLVRRPEDQVFVQAIEASTTTFVRGLSQGLTLAAAATASAAQDQAFDLGEDLGRLFALGCVAGIQPSKRESQRP